MKFVAIALLFLCPTIYGQNLLDGIKICNDKNNKLNYINVGNYAAYISSGRIDSIKSKDGLVCYDNKKLLFKLKNLRPENSDSFLIMQLTKQGVAIRANDTVLIINTAKSVSAIGNDAVSIYSLNHFDFFLQFENDYISRIEFLIGNFYYTIKLHPVKYFTSWDIKSVSKTKENELTFTFEDNKPYLLEFRDNVKKTGLLLLTGKDRDVFQSLNVFRIKSNKVISIDPSYKIKYDKRGKDLSDKTKYYCLGNG